MKNDIFNKHNIFIVATTDNQYLVYAPLSGVAFYASREELQQISQIIVNQESNEISESLLDKCEIIYETKSTDTIQELTILLNQKCNFSCSYCYSANGRSSVVLDKQKIFSVLDFFINPTRGTGLSIVFSGGGDPILSFDEFKSSVEYARKISNKYSINLNIGIVTNGSTLSDDYINYIKVNHIDLVVSFDILKDVHNTQRSHYDEVVSTIDKLCRKGIQFGVRSTITPLNVSRQCEMVEELHSNFPQIKGAAFEAVLNKKLFSSSAELKQFYEDFIHNFFKAEQQGDEYGIIIGNTIVNSVDSCKERTCPGKLVITPEGHLVACSRLSSNKEMHYDYFKYGVVDKNKVYIDNEKYNTLMSHNVRTKSECQSCVAKWHCGGGCLLAEVSNSAEYFSEYCYFMQNMVISVVENRIKQVV